MAGTVFGLVTHAVLAGVGLSAPVMSSAEAFTIVKLVGAVYLVVLGLRTLWDTHPACRQTGRRLRGTVVVPSSRAIAGTC